MDEIERRAARAAAIAEAGGIEQAIARGVLPPQLEVTLSEALVLGLLRQGVTRFLCVLGHGSTEVGEVLRVYAEAGLLRACGVRSEIEASHAASALRWVTGEKAAVVTSIGPGALQALAAALVPASDGVGVWYLLGDETSEDEGPNMQQIPGVEQNAYLRLFGTLGAAYTLHTPQALPAALRRGLNVVDHPHRAGPFFLLLPLNTQPASVGGINLGQLPVGSPPALGAAADDGGYERAARALLEAERVVVKVGGGGRHCGDALRDFLTLADAVAVTSPLVSGVLPYVHPRNMTVGGSKGSLCGNYAMEQADMLVAIGSRAVCQADCSRTGYPRVEQVVNINADIEAATHYGRTEALVGEAQATLEKLNDALRALGADGRERASSWSDECAEQKRAWNAFKQERYKTAVLPDATWGRSVLTQPAAIHVASTWAREVGAVSFFDAGDVQANGFQVVEDTQLGQTFTETGASYMGFAVSALLATALTEAPFYGVAFSGDGSFTMNPQILLDGVEHGACGCIVLLDNRRMGAISGLQRAQYGCDFATHDGVEVDYVAWARSVAGVKGIACVYSPDALVDALEEARAYAGLSLIHVPVYYGEDPLGELGAFGRWNVGNWVSETQALRRQIGL